MTIDPAMLEAILQESGARLTEVFAKELADLSEAASWRTVMAERLRLSAGPVFARTERPQPNKTPPMLTAAFCLAAEADGVEREDIGDQFRQLAAGISLLQRRAIDSGQVIEVLMLAAE